MGETNREGGGDISTKKGGLEGLRVGQDKLGKNFKQEQKCAIRP